VHFVNVTLDTACLTSVNNDVIITSLKRQCASSTACLADVKMMVLPWSFLCLYLRILFRFVVVSSLLSVICLFYVRWSWGMSFLGCGAVYAASIFRLESSWKTLLPVRSPTRRRIPEDSNLHIIQVHLPIILFCFNIICCFHRGCSRLMYPVEVRASYTRLYPDFYWLLFIKGNCFIK
jgi:hypothetical protein